MRVALTPLDVKHLHDDASRLLSASAETVAGWWTELTGWSQDTVDAAPAPLHPR